MNQGLRGDGDVEDVDGYCPPQDGRVFGDDDDNDFPSWGGQYPSTSSTKYQTNTKFT